jgi:tRNA(Ile)-lysidine synthase
MSGALDALAAFDRRLDPSTSAPIAVAVSGGGDSLAALIATLAWARPCGRPVIALCVDHGLQPQSAAWTAFAGEAARRLGAGFRALAWDGEKPTAGLPAAARAARHRLIAAAAREAGAQVVVVGHTADDLVETAIMRAAGARLSAPREWTASPAWPEGRGVFLLRPLLALSRAALREALRARGETWIEDPANDDPRYARARARRALAVGAAYAPVAETKLETGDDAAALAGLARAAAVSEAGAIRIPRAALEAASKHAARRFLSAAVACAGGGERTPRRERIEALQRRIAGEATLSATLCGAKLLAAEDAVLVVRNAGEAARGGLAPLALTCGEPVVWDGRFLIESQTPARVRALAGAAGRLQAAARRRLRETPAAARPALPLVEAADAVPLCPVLETESPVLAHCLVGDRLIAACAAISKEPAT